MSKAHMGRKRETPAISPSVGGGCAWPSVEDPLAGLDLHYLLERPPIPLDLSAAAEGLRGKRLLMTGAGGSIGSSLADLLLSFQPAELVLLEHHEGSLFDQSQRLAAAYPNAPVRFVLADVRDRAKLARVFTAHRPEIVFHLAAYKHVHLAEENPDQAIAVNVMGTLVVAEQALETGVKRLVYSSTDKAVNPHGVYGATKRASELLLLALDREGLGTSFRIARLVNTLGAQGGVIRTFARQIKSGQPITLTHEEMTRYWITMAEAVQFLAMAAGLPDLRGILLLDLGGPVSLLKVARRLFALIGQGGQLEIAHVGIRPGERLHEELTYHYEKAVPSPYPGILTVSETSECCPSLASLKRHLDRIETTLGRGSVDLLREQLFDLVRPIPLAVGS